MPAMILLVLRRTVVAGVLGVLVHREGGVARTPHPGNPVPMEVLEAVEVVLLVSG